MLMRDIWNQAVWIRRIGGGPGQAVFRRLISSL